MLPVYICDDNQTELNYVKKIVENYVLIEDLDIRVVYADPDPNKLLVYLSEHPVASLYFLDIDLNCGEIDGFLLSHKIREYDPRGFIVIITAHEEMQNKAFQYRIEAMDYIIKGYDTDQFNKRIVNCINNAYKLYSIPTVEKKKVVIKMSGGKTIALYPDDISLIETDPIAIHRLAIYHSGTRVDAYYSLKEFEELLKDEKQFIRCHKSCIVNINHITELDGKNYLVKLDESLTCPVAIRSFKKLEKLYLSLSQK